MNFSTKKLSATLLSGVLICVSAVAGYYTLFGTFHDYDDEGYLMLTLRDYVQGHVLYDQVYSNYGPFYYLFHGLLHGPLGIPVTHDGVRFIVLGFWITLVLSCFRLVSYLTRSNVFAFLACVPFGWMLGSLAAEPGHPQGLVLILIAAVLLLPSVSRWNDSGRMFLFAATGACVAALILVKPNIGGLLLLGVLWAMLSVTKRTPLTSLSRYLLAGASVCLPLVLMSARLSQRWTQKYALLTIMTLAPIFFLLLRPGRDEIRRKDWSIFAIFSGLAGTAIIAVVMVQGTTLYSVVYTMLLLPLRFSSVYTAPLDLDRAAFFLGTGSLLLFGALLLVDRPVLELRFGQRAFGTAADRRFAVPLETLLLGIFGAMVMYYSYRADYGGLWRASPLLWTGLLPRQSENGEEPARYFLRVLLVVTAAFQLLHAYPVAGSQVTWSLMWLVPLGMVCLHDSLAALPWASLFTQSRLLSLRRAATSVLILMALGISVQRTWIVMKHYRSLEPLNLPGARRLRTDWLTASTYRWLTANLNAHSDAFISLPGLDSLYIWTRMKAPAMFSGSFWMGFTTDEQQNATITDLSRSPTAAIIRNTRLADQWSPGNSFSDRPLVAYIDHNFHTVGRIGDYEFMVRKEREPFVLETEPLLKYSLIRMPGITVQTRVELVTIDGMDALLSSSANQIRFDWPADAHGVSGGYGLRPDVCGKDGTPIRLTIQKDNVAGGGKILLFEQTLNPKIPEDCGIHRFEISVPPAKNEPGMNEKLGFTTVPLGGPPADDWVYWTAVKLQ